MQIHRNNLFIYFVELIVALGSFCLVVLFSVTIEASLPDPLNPNAPPKDDSEIPPPTFNIPGATQPSANQGGAGDPGSNGAQAVPGIGGITPMSGSILSGFMEPFEYEPAGRKDPFAVPTMEKPLPPGSFHGPILPLQRFKLEELALMGIIWDVSKPRAMVRDPGGQIHVLGPNAKLGDKNGYIAVIREGEIVVIETFEEDGKLFSAARVVKLTSGAVPGAVQQ